MKRLWLLIISSVLFSHQQYIISYTEGIIANVYNKQGIKTNENKKVCSLIALPPKSMNTEPCPFKITNNSGRISISSAVPQYDKTLY